MNGNEVNKAVGTGREAPKESFTELFGQLVKNLAAIVHNEIELVIQRLREKTRDLKGALFIVAIGLMISFVAFMSLCAAIVIGLTAFIPLVFAAIVTGAAVGLIGIVITAVGYEKLKKSFHKK